ncbi:FAD-binding protein [Melia azedarach]|uniref:FAD-binding protein n=1 Tax=Melia azedarach TaxID=155640 RepID=A0ACC1XT81_MELAZ|nr:FAD-binding protein [Melia azedarach]
MESDQGKLKSELKEKVFQIFKDFMTRLAKLEELGAAGSRLLAGFQQGLEFLRRPPIGRTSELIGNIINANETKRVKSYFEAGCVNVHDSVQNISKLRMNLVGLKDHLSEAKSTLNQLECLLEDVSFAIQTANKCLSSLWDKDFSNALDQQATYDKPITSSDLQEHEIMEIVALMGIIYSMVKQDYVMQERIVTSLSVKTLSGELAGYCLMWSLHPYMNDEIMHQAWKLVP